MCHSIRLLNLLLLALNARGVMVGERLN
ncbi:leu operon leader peptide [Xenorhabdus sp. 42]|uniref:Leu operon leader peptide n=1 Tax=Xenorhabdus szentirmaii TaxID=290112 RepID=A0AAW3YU77_9GAMM|nr:leu operon leader peptide [Xenorhabdus sp. 38]MBD2801131.1 leu operon leader peptide [Xenorhabdus sp. M]MBD2805511.1 leu operon leader peptide [Xenorhabdus sp. ZM]MBD2822287.1 leu operon leader peptide [Xenorhabdus sp. 42]